MLSDMLNVTSSKMLYIGDEEKDIIGANKSGYISVFIDRRETGINYGQLYTIKSLKEILNYLPDA